MSEPQDRRTVVEVRLRQMATDLINRFEISKQEAEEQINSAIDEWFEGGGLQRAVNDALNKHIHEVINRQISGYSGFMSDEDIKKGLERTVLSYMQKAIRRKINKLESEMEESNSKKE